MENFQELRSINFKKGLIIPNVFLYIFFVMNSKSILQKEKKSLILGIIHLDFPQ